MMNRIKREWAVVIFVLAVVGFYAFSFNYSKAATTSTVSTSVTVGNAAPTVSSVMLNGDTTITLTEASTANISCAGTLTDLNGGADIYAATATIYRSGAANGAACTASTTSCYQIASTSCVLGVAAGNNKPATCTAAIWFYADPTDAGTTYAAQTWACQMTATDTSTAVGSATDATPPDMGSLAAQSITAAVNYGSLSANYTPVNLSQLTVVTTTGNVSIDVNLSGSTMSDGAGHTIAVGQQKYATTTAGWTTSTVLTGSPVALVLNMGKPNSSPSGITSSAYWGIAIPSGQAAAAYSGIITSTAFAH